MLGYIIKRKNIKGKQVYYTGLFEGEKWGSDVIMSMLYKNLKDAQEEMQYLEENIHNLSCYIQKIEINEL